MATRIGVLLSVIFGIVVVIAGQVGFPTIKLIGHVYVDTFLVGLCAFALLPVMMLIARLRIPNAEIYFSRYALSVERIGHTGLGYAAGFLGFCLVAAITSPVLIRFGILHGIR